MEILRPFSGTAIEATYRPEPIEMMKEEAAIANEDQRGYVRDLITG